MSRLRTSEGRASRRSWDATRESGSISSRRGSRRWRRLQGYRSLRWVMRAGTGRSLEGCRGRSSLLRNKTTIISHSRSLSCISYYRYLRCTGCPWLSIAKEQESIQFDSERDISKLPLVPLRHHPSSSLHHGCHDYYGTTREYRIASGSRGAADRVVARRPQLWLRCETKEFEHRAALTPTTAKTLMDAGFIITVERDPQRVFADAEYEA